MKPLQAPFISFTFSSSQISDPRLRLSQGTQVTFPPSESWEILIISARHEHDSSPSSQLPIRCMPIYRVNSVFGFSSFGLSSSVIVKQADFQLQLALLNSSQAAMFLKQGNLSPHLGVTRCKWFTQNKMSEARSLVPMRGTGGCIMLLGVQVVRQTKQQNPAPHGTK